VAPKKSKKTSSKKLKKVPLKKVQSLTITSPTHKGWIQVD
jgi:hypothetical protein